MKRVNKEVSAALKILFVGNSFTARNNVPELIAGMAAKRGRILEQKLISAGGASLRMHWNKGEAQRAIESTSFDYVVLQEQSTLPVKNANRMYENIRLFNGAITAAGAKTVLYMTWSREHEPQNQQLIADAYNNIGAELGAIVVPVGVAWKCVLAENPLISLYDKDGSHPSVAGSWLAACVFFSVLYNESPAGLDFEVAGLGENRDILQISAWKAVSSSQ